ncbi:response regulator [Anaeromyxobacter paludicola]|uniref:Response regulatory domain-containing protein n=1 Tax=Anaeromyxobacter paludicola TaxID=2918171 RepID=A0ABM7X7V5_9BACT|nr:response regulator [Anaeromyxobacter paludicola]BDG07926.1 hypothetical protein AMPC_10390 [Anaeromyxobacter paludicola]
MYRILVVDDEPQVAKALRRLLSKEFEVEVAYGGAEALEKLETFQPDAVLTDRRMPGLSGPDLLAEVKRRMPLALRVIVSGVSDDPDQPASEQAGGICSYLPKPWDESEVLGLFRSALPARDLLRALRKGLACAPGIQAELVQKDRKLVLRAFRAGTPIPPQQALRILAAFARELDEESLQALGSLLEPHDITVAAEGGGTEAGLAVELPVPEPLLASGSR